MVSFEVMALWMTLDSKLHFAPALGRDLWAMWKFFDKNFATSVIAFKGGFSPLNPPQMGAAAPRPRFFIFPYFSRPAALYKTHNIILICGVVLM